MSTRLPAPSEAAAAHSEALRAHIVEAIQASNHWIPFDRYMDLALYAPGLGYYTAGARKIGAAGEGGDFVTAPEISPLFGHALAAQVADVLHLIAPGKPARILEFGAGTGRLARDVLDALAHLNVEVEQYGIVEVSADLRDRQRTLLAGRPVVWHDAPSEHVDGVILANEVLDVMPVRLFVKRADGVHERGVTLEEGALRFGERATDATLAQAVQTIEAEAGVLREGYASEVGLVARAWTAQLASVLGRGAIFLIDYGFPRREYYAAQRLMGTLMCHYRHRAHADPLWLPGLNDITAHVDWTAIAESAHDAGLDVLGYTSQSRFLMNCGALELLAHDQTPARTAAVQRLLSEAEMGELFKVLALGRGIEGPLRGFARGDRLHTL